MVSSGSLARTGGATAPYLLSLLRVVAGLLLLNFGTQKILGFPVAPQLPPVGSLPWIAGLLELVLGTLVVIGFQTRISAFILSGLMAFAYFIGHAPRDFFPSLNGGMAAAALCFTFLYIAAAGAGPISVDALLNRSRSGR